MKGSGAVDFEAIESLDGTFVANKYDKKTAPNGMGGDSSAWAGSIREVNKEDILAEEYFKD